MQTLRKPLLAALITLWLAATAAAQVQTTNVTGTVVDATGQPVPNARLTITKVVKGGVVVSTRQIDIRADSAGHVNFNVLRGSTAYFEGNVVGLERPGGTALLVPDAASADFSTLLPTVPPPAGALLTHAAVKGSTTQLGHLKCGDGVTCLDGVISAGAGGATTLDGLTDAQVSSPAAGHTLVFDGSLFVNRALTAADVGLPNADDTSDAAKPVSTATQAALDAKADASALTAEAATRASADTTLQTNVTAEASTRAAADALLAPLTSPALTGTPTAPTAAPGTSTTQLATTAFSATAVATEAAARATAVSALSTVYQPLDPDLTTIAGLSASASDVMQFVSGAWASRTVAQLKTSLGLAASDVGLGSVTNDAQLKVASNLSDLNSAATARTNLGLGTMATQAESSYALLAGRAGGQTLNGGTAASENIIIQSTGHATKGYILLGTGGLVGVNKPTPLAQMHVQAATAGTKGLIVQMAASATANPVEVQDSTGAAVAHFKTTGRLNLQGSGGATLGGASDALLILNGAGSDYTAAWATSFSDNSTSYQLSTAGLKLKSAGCVTFSSGTNATAGADSFLCRAGAGAFSFGSTSGGTDGKLKLLSTQIGTTTAKGVCDSTARGTLYTEFGGAGVADKIFQCLKSSSDTYSWVQIVSAP